jgi:hypothetical protein
MAVTDFVANVSETSAIIEMSRGNIGTVGDIQGRRRMVHEFLLVVPIVSNVTLGINYGQQGTELTGTATGGGGGGPTYYSY